MSISDQIKHAPGNLGAASRGSRAAVNQAASRAFYALRALSERKTAADYRANYGLDSFSTSDIADMRADDTWPVGKRPRPIG